MSMYVVSKVSAASEGPVSQSLCLGKSNLEAQLSECLTRMQIRHEEEVSTLKDDDFVFLLGSLFLLWCWWWWC